MGPKSTLKFPHRNVLSFLREIIRRNRKSGNVRTKCWPFPAKNNFRQKWCSTLGWGDFGVDSGRKKIR